MYIAIWSCIHIIIIDIHKIQVDPAYAAGRVFEAINTSVLAWRFNKIGALIGLLLYTTLTFALIVASNLLD